MGKKNEATRGRYELKMRSSDPSYRRVHGNYPAKKYAKGTPAVTRLSFEFMGSSTQFIDIAAALSAINRKGFRQGCYYYVNSVEFYDATTNVVDLHTVPDTWVTRAAYRRAKAIYDKMNEIATENVPTILPKYHDFKVYFSNFHRVTGTKSPALYGINSDKTEYPPDEWVYSQLVSADDDGDAAQQADNFFLHMIGGDTGSADNWESVGIIKSYGDTRVEPDGSGQPLLPANLNDDPLLNLFDYSSEEQMNDVITRLDEDNDATPYDANTYIGESSHSAQHVARLTTTSESGRVAKSEGFCAPLGLIVVDPASAMAADNKFRIVLNLAVGTYHGVYAERMA
jgi:hypothetical protein